MDPDAPDFDFDAVPAYRRAIALRPDLVGAQLNLGNALYAAHRFPEAQAAFEATLRNAVTGVGAPW